MADAKKKNAKKKAPPELTPEQRRKLAEKQVIGAGMALDFAIRLISTTVRRNCWRASPMTRIVLLKRQSTVPKRRRSPKTAGRLPIRLHWQPKKLR